MSDAAPRRVLIIDDNRSAAETLATLIRLLGHEVITAYDGVAGVQAALAFRPELILLDLVMPNVDGFAVARALRNLSMNARIVALTAFTQPAFLEVADNAGFDSVVPKPATAEQLTKLLTH